MTREDINDIINTICPNDEDFEKAYISPAYLKKELEALALEQCEDVMAIHTQGLDEGIRCAMCTNSLKSDRGCNGGCVVNENMYKEVMNTIENHIVPPVTPTSSKMEQVEWVSVSERLPEANRAVLTYVDTGATKTYCLAYWNDMIETWEEWIGYDLIEKDRGYKVLAWMPLPQPYRAESEDK